MARRPRNKVHNLPVETRLRVYGWLCDGIAYGQIIARLEREGIAGDRLPSPNSLTATRRRDPDYKRFRDRRLELDRESMADRELAAMMNDGRGPESMIDLIVMDCVRAVRSETRGGADMGMEQVAAITKAINPLLRHQIAEAKLEADARLETQKSRVAELKAKVDELVDENRRMREAMDRAGVSMESGRQAVDLATVSEKMDELLGG